MKLDDPPIKYHCGTEAKVGDVVDFDGVRATVDSVIASIEDLRAWSLDQPGLMFSTEKLGLVFQSANSNCWPECVFLRRGS